LVENYSQNKTQQIANQ